MHVSPVGSVALRRCALGALLLLLVGTALGCTSIAGKKTEADKLTAPKLGACRTVTPKDVEQPSNAAPIVACTKNHTAETFAIGTFSTALAGASYQSTELGRYIFKTCGPAFLRFLGGDESLADRSLLSWAWFRPSEAAWAKNARWYRCDVVGGPSRASSYRALPQTARAFLSRKPPEDWMMCARGKTVAGSAKVPCTATHDWRAVTTIKLGQPNDPYPGDRLAQI
ncbi:MAG: septum formation family protein, partial [Actinomycetota bacterium]|nr:septum formation family protein [Actinomycetota bacterium]